MFEDKIDYIKKFMGSGNAASVSKVDANANVINKTIATLEAELWKPETIKVNRGIITQQLIKNYGIKTAIDFITDVESHNIYIHDETSLKPYCASITLYPFLLEGTKPLGGTSRAPKNLQSFCGSFCNLIYQVASDFAGAVATVEFLMYFDYFARKTYGNQYLTTHMNEVQQCFQQVVYSLNQPASARGNQSVFWNISVFDKYYFESMFGEFFFPDGSQSNYESVCALQTVFLAWFTEERKKELLTFPVVTCAYLVDKVTHTPKDRMFVEELALHMSNGLSFFHYESTSADSLASCCRLRNEVDNNDFSYTLGAGGVSTGSFQVITINMNRLAQQHNNRDMQALQELLTRVYKYLACYREVVADYIEGGLLPTYTKGFISLDKQFGTIGINGALESYETTEDVLRYDTYLKCILMTIKRYNAKARKQYGFKINTEFVPAENLGVKNAKWDKEDGLKVPRDCYNSYFFAVEDESLTILDKLEFHSEKISQYLDGGAACHLNLEHIPSYAQALAIIYAACQQGVPYWTTNVLSTLCSKCGYIDPETRTKCIKCGNTDLDYGTRIIGYLRPISSFSKERQKEAGRRFYNKISRRSV